MLETWRAASPGLLLGWCLVASAVAALVVAPGATAGIVAFASAGALVASARAWWRRDGWIALCFGKRLRAWLAAVAGLALVAGGVAFALSSADDARASPFAVVEALAGLVAALAGALLAAQGVTAIASSRRAPRSPRPPRPAPSPSPAPGSSR